MNAEPVTYQQHGNLKISKDKTYRFAQGYYIVSLQVNEFIRAAATYPIVFVRNNERFRPYALLGLNRGENLFIDEDGKWKTGYIPTVIRTHPFVLGKSPDQDGMMVCLDTDSELVSETEGEPLFDEAGKPAEVVERAQKALSELQRFVAFTRRFSDDLSERGLLSPLEIKIRESGGGSQSIDGCYGINEKRLNEMSDEGFLEMRRSGLLPLIYAQSLSMGQMERLLKLQKRPGDSPETA
jgi:hypothetical protein